ncbi:hypothetical protein LCGC14_2170110 [marine sediment metagenome]|uniref:Uncharacterized protein n=1 Tax=marine sediment metagenome TaxID=412755 RepID=A0A0F9GLB0_9ZZZZ|nr:hypothetical protein [Porticoccus sp.]
MTISLIDRQIYVNEADKSNFIGVKGETSDGRFFRYALEGGNAVVSSVLCQSRVSDADWDTIAIATTTLPTDTKINITSEGNDTFTKDELENGYLTCETDPGNTGPNFWRIQGNDVVVSAGDDFNIYLAEGATIGQVLTASTDTINFAPSPWSKFIVYPASSTGVAVGVTMIQVSAANYCWLQTRGICGVRMQDPAATVGEGLVPDDSDAGNLVNVTTSAQAQVVSQTLTVQGLTNSDIIPVFLTVE